METNQRVAIIFSDSTRICILTEWSHTINYLAD